VLSRLDVPKAFIDLIFPSEAILDQLFNETLSNSVFNFEDLLSPSFDLRDFVDDGKRFSLEHQRTCAISIE
jgi:hypothetical protein